MNSALNVVVDVQAVLDRLEDYSLPPEQYLDRRFGRGRWKFDAYCDCYIVADYPRGPGRSYVIVERNLKEDRVYVQSTQIN